MLSVEISPSIASEALAGPHGKKSKRLLILIINLSAFFRMALAEKELLMEPLELPPAAAIVGFENAPLFSPIYAYSTLELKFPLKRAELVRFIEKGKKQDVTHGTGSLAQLAPFTHPPLPELNEHEKRYIAIWKREGYLGASQRYAISMGAFATKNGRVYFWRKLNDRVLFVGQEKKGCYLVLPEE